MLDLSARFSTGAGAAEAADARRRAVAMMADFMLTFVWGMLCVGGGLWK